ncbi:xin actin-binding repeat-containing protein 1 [Discoglossus pictus]
MSDKLVNASKQTEKKVEDELPPPPPPDSAQPTVMLSGSQESGFLPPPPPKESFSKFYEQRQVNELKRLYRHMHPELRKNLEQAVTHDLSELISTDEPNQESSINLDAVLPGEVQSMRWIFENWKLDSIGEHKGSKKLTEEEDVLGGSVKNTSLKFQDQQCKDSTTSRKEHTKGDVKTALWLFETQPLDSLNKIYPDETDVQEAVLKDSVEGGDVKGTKFIFENCSLDEVGRCNSVKEQSLLQLKSEIQELKRDVKKSIKLFQTEPLCAIRDKTGNIHEIKSVCREETQSNNVNTARWLFETQPLDTIHKDASSIQIIRGISLEEIEKGGVNAAKWIFETQPLDTIKEHIDEGVFQASPDTIQGADVNQQCSQFEAKPLESTKSECMSREEIVAGDVKSSLWLFETQPMETLKGNFEVGQLKKIELQNEEKGDVKQRKHVFETCALDSISKAEDESTEDLGEAKDIVKGDVKSFKKLFETLPLDSITNTSSIVVSNQEDIQVGNVKANQLLFETTPLYAIEDSLGNFHEVTSVSREQVISGDVKNYKWMFETKQLDQFNDNNLKVDIIKGITKQEILSGDVRTARWLFETQPVDVIHQEKNESEQHSSVQKQVSQKGDVKKCRWLFETQPVDVLYDKMENNNEKETLPQGDVKSYTWMFETQPLDSLKDTEEHYIKVSAALPDNFQGVNVKTTKHLFETEPLDNISNRSECKKVIRYSSRVEMQSGEVSRVKEIFETKPKEGISLKQDILEDDNIQAGSVNKFTWLFENCPMDSMANNKDGFQEIPPEMDVKGGDVGGKKFIFETYSLDQIQQESSETEIKKVQEVISRGDVKSCTMQFETKPLYAIQDKGGEYHEVTSVKKEEVMKGDVRGAKWLFETKPLDRINKDEEVFVIRAVTQEDIEKGCVKSARWRFETEPLDSITDDGKQLRRTVDDVQKGDVQLNKQLFESQQVNQKKYVRLVSVSDVQKGNVRTSTWLFENQPIDCLKGESEEHPGIVTVQREDNQKGDVKRCTWLFESQPLDSLKDNDTSITPQTQEVVPQANVKSTTWLFESTPLDKFESTNKTTVEHREINVKNTLSAFFSCEIIQHKGIVIESFDDGNVKMVKYQLRKPETTEIEKEEVVGGNLQRILLQLLHRTDIDSHGYLVVENSKGELEITKLQLLNQSESGAQEEGQVRDDVAKALQTLLNEDQSIKTGIIMEESEKASVKIIIYSISSCCTFSVVENDIVKGDVKSTIGSLIACSQEPQRKVSVVREQNEKGNVQLYKSCIEKGDLEYLKSLQADSEIEALMLAQSENMNPVLKGVETSVQQQQEVRTGLENQNTIGAECVNIISNPIIIQPTLTERKVDLPVDMKVTTSLEKSKNEHKTVSARETKSVLHEITATKQQTNLAASKKTSFEGKTLQKESTSGSDLQAALLDLRQATAEAKNIQHQVECKLQNSTQEVQLCSEKITGNMMASVQPTMQHQECSTTKHTSSTKTTVQETRKCYSSLQMSTASSKKVSASGMEDQVQQLFESGEVATSAEDSIKDIVDSPKQAKNYLNPFIESDYKMYSVQDEREQDMVRGDVKAAIRALQCSSSEQKEVEKEEVVRGNLASALQSLEKSNVNVSKGDFKAAMIYKNAGKSYSGNKRTDAQQISTQDVMKPVQQSDIDFHVPSAAVIGKESYQAPKTSNVEATKDESPMVNNSIPKISDSVPNKASENTLDENANALSTSQTSVPQRKKPVPPPKPKHLPANPNPPPYHYTRKQPISTSPQLPSSSCEANPSTSVTDLGNILVEEQCTGEDTSQTSKYQCKKKKKETLQIINKKEKHTLISNNCQYECKMNVDNSKTEQISKESNIPLNELPVPKQELEHLPVLEEHVISQEVKRDKDICQAWEGQKEVKKKKSVTVVQTKDGDNHWKNQGVVMRVKQKKETADEKRKRLSVHMDDIMKGNVNAAMDIFENMKKQEELQRILNKVKEMEEETCHVDVRSMKGVFENAEDRVESSHDGAKPQLREKMLQKEESFEIKEDTESVSSVELAFEDLEKASTEIKYLKEQTLAKLLDIEETIKKALYSVSNLKSESDIAGLSGLFRESLESSTNLVPSNNIRKISIVSSKAKPDKPTELSVQKSLDIVNDRDVAQPKKIELDVTPTSSRAISPASPSFITIESAARKSTQQNGGCLPSVSTAKSLKNGQVTKDSVQEQNEQVDYGQVQKGSNKYCKHESSDQYNKWSNDNASFSQNAHASLYSPASPMNSRRQKSVLELKTGPEGPKVIGTTVVTEKYEECDQFGNKVTRSKTSRTVTQQADTQTSSTYEVMSATPRYEVTASPILRRHIAPSVDSSMPANDTGVVFVTFNNSKFSKK